MVPLVRRFVLVLLVAICGSLFSVAPVLASPQDVLNDFATGPNGGGTIERCYSTEDFNAALAIARRDKAQYSGATDVIAEKRAECAGRITTAAVDTSKDDGGVPVIAILAAILALVAIAAAAVVARRRRHDDQFGGDDPPDAA